VGQEGWQHLKPFLEIGGQIVAVAYIVKITPPTKAEITGAAIIHMAHTENVPVPAKDWPKLREFFSQECERPLD
jgi:hypothetical protein